MSKNIGSTSLNIRISNYFDKLLEDLIINKEFPSKSEIIRTALTEYFANNKDLLWERINQKSMEGKNLGFFESRMKTLEIKPPDQFANIIFFIFPKIRLENEIPINKEVFRDSIVLNWNKDKHWALKEDPTLEDNTFLITHPIKLSKDKEYSQIFEISKEGQLVINKIVPRIVTSQQKCISTTDIHGILIGLEPHIKNIYKEYRDEFELRLILNNVKDCFLGKHDLQRGRGFISKYTNSKEQKKDNIEIEIKISKFETLFKETRSIIFEKVQRKFGISKWE